ncbi:hypothetical protein BT96DRAFT_644709 [Gymnopus androsaceus JB14]|uniref:Uncharacterized protein n=1 Tax=Gymnopus androsaceus JB14 TaxID=1447944 RepID=A0A6A4GGE2_9AGAR|nr:hypothetical protein BT96DRAFT_644709 [Gymnopus androsaceus JB14]
MTASPSTGIPAIKSLLVDLSTSLYIQAWDDDPTEIGGSLESSANIPIYVNTSTPGWLKVEFDWEHGRMDLFDNVAVAIFSPLPLLQLRNLHIDTSYHVHESSTYYPGCAKIFGSLPQITTLTIDGASGHENFFGACTNIQDIPAASDGVSSGTGHPTPNRAQGATLLHSLLDYLMQREKLQYPIRELYLEDCIHLTSEEVEELEEVVGVQWDKVERGYGDEDMSSSESRCYA